MNSMFGGWGHLSRTRYINPIFETNLYLHGESFIPGQDIPQRFYEKFCLYHNSVYRVTDDNGEDCPPLACLFCKSPELSEQLFVAKENGQIVLLDTSTDAEETEMAAWIAHTNAILDLKWLAADQMMLTASGDHTIALTDVEVMKRTATFCGHSGTVKCLTVKPNDFHIFCSGSRDGSLKLWDTRSCKMNHIKDIVGLACVGEIKGCHIPSDPTITEATPILRRLSRRSKAPGGISRSVTATVFVDPYKVVSAGSTDGILKVWDIRKMKSSGFTATPARTFPYSGFAQKSIGFSDMTVSSNGCQLYAYCLDGGIYQYDFASSSSSPSYIYSIGHQASSFYIKMSLSSDDKMLLCGSHNGQAYIYPVAPRADLSRSPIILSGHENEVSAVQFSPTDPLQLATVSDDCTVAIWRYRSSATDGKYNDGSEHVKAMGVPKYDAQNFTPTKDFSQTWNPSRPGQPHQISSSIRGASWFCDMRQLLSPGSDSNSIPRVSRRFTIRSPRQKRQASICRFLSPMIPLTGNNSVIINDENADPLNLTPQTPTSVNFSALLSRSHSVQKRLYCGRSGGGLKETDNESNSNQNAFLDSPSNLHSLTAPPSKRLRSMTFTGQNDLSTTPLRAATRNQLLRRRSARLGQKPPLKENILQYFTSLAEDHDENL